jgi:chromatin segregation and condensation protein Rec8/ScpA/Scc1 (kleisin family)
MDDTPIHVYQAQIMERLEREPQLSLTALFTPPHHRGRLLGLFLALLELIKSRRIIAEQPDVFGEIWLNRAPAASAEPAPAQNSQVPAVQAPNTNDAPPPE